jgi:transposase
MCKLHHWSRILIRNGYDVKIIPPQFVKPFVKSNKNDTQAIHRISKANQIRGLVTDYGLVTPKELSSLRRAILE